MDFFQVRSGNCMASVNVCPEAGETAFTAAGELCRYLGLQMGVCVNYASPVAPREGICLGYNKTDLGDDGFSFAFEENTLFIDGGKRGIIYGVFELLEKLGFRFFTAECQLIPEGTELSLQKKDISCKPVFEYRCTNWRGMNADFAPRVKINSLLGGSLPASYGGDIHYQGFVHTIGDLAEMERVDGGYTDRQPCLSDEAVYGTVVKNVRRRIEEDPSAAIVSVSQNDSHEWGRGCRCEACSRADREEGTPMGSLLKFVNRVADEVGKDYPEVALDTLAYRYTRKTPLKLTAKQNVIVRLCSIECCFSHPIDECDRSVYEVKDSGFAETLKKWKDHCGRIYIWDYTTNFQSYHTMFPNFGVLRKNIRFFADNNVKGVFEQGDAETLSGEFGELRTYLLAKLLWNPYMSSEEYENHMREFVFGYYGRGGKYILEYLDYLAEAAKDVHFGIYYPDSTALFIDPDKNMTERERKEAFLLRGKELFAKAKEYANETEKKRIDRSEIQLDIYQWFLIAGEAGADKTALEACGKELWQKIMDSGISAMHEGGSAFRNSTPDFCTFPCYW